jgi:import inner membrane translocase subunit TIM16
MQKQASASRHPVTLFGYSHLLCSAGGGAAAASVQRTTTLKMPAEQARSILNLNGTFTKEDVIRQFNKYYVANDPEKGGSFYLQSKIWNAKEVVLEEVKKSSTPLS